ncbi:MAG TPA: tryptophan synthase subunit alpha [Blastocatellia bacterium]|nr:tryptophan synthase subunit alpha [Blastocatellia bacterium]
MTQDSVTSATGINSGPGRISASFAELSRAGRKAFIPYLTAGDPELSLTVELILELERAGADIIELGVPFSDPMADGPVIQRASERALLKGVTIRDCLECVRRVRAKSQVPIVLFSYFNPLLSLGFDSMADELERAGVDGVLVTDLVPEEAEEFISQMREKDIDTVFLVAPTSTDERIRMVAEASRGFIYAVSRTGVTGVQESLAQSASNLVKRVRPFTDLPVAVGFGLSTPDQVAAVWQVADAAVVGSRIVAEIERLRGDNSLVKQVGRLARTLTSARAG